MITQVALLAATLALPPDRNNPFLSNATVTYGWPPQNLHSINTYDLKKPPNTGRWMVEDFGGIASLEDTMPLDPPCMYEDIGGDATIPDPSCQYEPIRSQCGDVQFPPCWAPSPEDVPNLENAPVLQMEYTVVFWNWERWDWPRVPRDGFYYYPEAMNKLLRQEILRHWQSSMQTINAVLLRDIGLSTKVRHVHFMSAADLLNWREDYTQLPTGFENVLRAHVPNIPELANGVIHINQNGGLSTGSPCGTLMRHTWAMYRFDIDPINSIMRNGWNRTMAHEFTHFAGDLRHIQCYRYGGPPYNGGPLEWADDGGACWGSSNCPSRERTSFMAYNWWCHEPPNSQFPLLRIGPYFDTINGEKVIGMARLVGVNNARAHACDCFYQVGTINLIDQIDTDGDEYPNAQDNCPTIANNQQRNFNRNLKGDECDYACSITKPTKSGWFLLLPTLFLIWRKNGRKVQYSSTHS